jgi:cyclic pyranopterin monophosphate synthase
MRAPLERPGGASRDASDLTHFDEHGQARMVDVTAKPMTQRVAVAKCAVVTTADTARVLGQTVEGMDMVEVARIAGIQGAKQTSTLIPLCHSIRVDRVVVDVVVEAHRIEVSAITEIFERTGVEMEALTACAVAALTLVNFLVEVDPGVAIEGLTLWHKSGGRSGDWHRGGPDDRLTAKPSTLAAPGSAVKET